MLMKINRITMEYAFDGGKTRQYLMPDGVHKMAHTYVRSPGFVEKKIAPSLMIDSNVIFNYFCNRKFKGVGQKFRRNQPGRKMKMEIVRVHEKGGGGYVSCF